MKSALLSFVSVARTKERTSGWVVFECLCDQTRVEVTAILYNVTCTCDDLVVSVLFNSGGREKHTHGEDKDPPHRHPLHVFIRGMTLLGVGFLDVGFQNCSIFNLAL